MLRQRCYKTQVREEINVSVLQNKTSPGTQDDGLSPCYWELVTYKETKEVTRNLTLETVNYPP